MESLRVKMRCKKCDGLAWYDAYWTEKWGICFKKIKCETCDKNKQDNNQSSFI